LFYNSLRELTIASFLDNTTLTTTNCNIHYYHSF